MERTPEFFNCRWFTSSFLDVALVVVIIVFKIRTVSLHMTGLIAVITGPLFNVTRVGTIKTATRLSTNVQRTHFLPHFSLRQ